MHHAPLLGHPGVYLGLFRSMLVILNIFEAYFLHLEAMLPNSQAFRTTTANRRDPLSSKLALLGEEENVPRFKKLMKRLFS